ncbi:phospholipid scramblase 2-like [Amphiura filiformis]|uniref:phospholipid scramblase 2-like n=1 Tax=Amphiura filiformis TaxID=82378 RepID=UPI003B20E8C0
MPKPTGVQNCPPGLEYLTQLDQLLVHQQVELMEVLTGLDFQNRYVIKNSMGQQVYFAGEQSTFCMRCFCQSQRTFNMTITDNNGQEVMKLYRPWKCCSGCGSCWCAGTCDCCTDEITVECPPGEVIGKIKHSGSKWYPHLAVKDTDDNTMFDIWGPCCLCQCICYHPDLNFKVYHGDNEIASIGKQWAGAVKECFTKVSNFGIQFPIDLEVRMKAMLIAATMLIEYLYIESQKDGGGGGGGGGGG